MSHFRLLRRAGASLALSAALVLLSAPAARAQTNLPPEEFSAFAIYMGTIATGATSQIVVNVSRWSSQAEQERLMTILREKGQQALINAFRNNRRVGTIRTPQSVGYDLQYATQESLPDGARRVILATDRPISFAEANARPHSMDYPFTIVELNMPAEGAGEGTMSIAARFVAVGKRIIVENFDTAPVQLKNVRSRVLEK